jgi:hypothetical protein
MNSVEGAVLMRGVDDVVDDEKGFGVCARCVGEAAFEFEVRIDGLRFEGDWVGSGFQISGCRTGADAAGSGSGALFWSSMAVVTASAIQTRSS